MLDHSRAEPMGILKDVLCQVGVTIILAKFFILDIPVDKDVPIVVGRIFLHTCGGIINTIKGTTSTFDGVFHQKFYAAKVRNRHEENNSEDEEEYNLKRDKNGKPFYGPTPAKYLNCDAQMDQALALQDVLNRFKKVCVWKKMIAFLGSLPVPLKNTEWIPSYSDNFVKKGDGDGKWHAKVRIVDPYKNVFDQGYETRATGRELSKFYKLILNNMGYGDVIEAMLEIMFDEEVTDEDLMSRKLIKFMLGGRGHTLIILEFACCLGLYTSDEIQDEGFETYFHRGLRSDD
ncbi:hypothetical protein Tco_0823935 [Tanacetum coccineum]|uniref:Uncharacterized protein n=1 Tax=Tanacetum coccineum TaxID=301880 RepID=A0ABQ5AJB2_9ASTR